MEGNALCSRRFGFKLIETIYQQHLPRIARQVGVPLSACLGRIASWAMLAREGAGETALQQRGIKACRRTLPAT